MPAHLLRLQPGEGPEEIPMRPITVSSVLVLIAAALFLLAAFGVSLGAVSLVPLGLAVYMASHLVP
jgi:hypothetical protein